MKPCFTSLAQIEMPILVYGTAWKKDKTADLVALALEKGFRGIDTACQPKHYNEPLVGEGLQRSYAKDLKREDLFIQTKFTPISGQDPNNIPYDINTSLTEQVKQSLAVSKKNLQTDYIDSLVLHSPLNTWAELSEVWNAFEGFVSNGDVRQLGISNCYDLEVFTQLFEQSSVKPSVIQNRFYSDTKYDLNLRRFCQDKGVIYQSFWTLSANPDILASEVILKISEDQNKTPAQVFFRYLNYLDIIPLSGTTSAQHMREDLEISSFSLSGEECAAINSLGPFN